MKNITLSLLLGSVVILSGCTTKEDFVLFSKTAINKPGINKSVTKLKRPTSYEYKINPHDRVSITMYNHPELGTSSVQSQREDTRGVLVNSKGYIRLPLIKSIHIAGITQTSAQRKIEKAYGKFLEDAELSLEVLNKRAHILGEVKNPGEIPLFNERLSILQILAKAGGMTDEADRKSILVLRKIGQKSYAKRIDLTGANSLVQANTMIQPNDVVYVVPNGMKSFNTGVREFTPVFQLVNSVIQPFWYLDQLND